VSTFDKLNLKDQKQILVLNAPESFEPELKSLRGVTVVRDLKNAGDVEFALAFVIKQQQVDTLAKAIAKKAQGDSVVWFAYPKGSSKKYKSEINRDAGWQVLGDAGFEPVRMVAIDEDWSAVRFRRADFIKSLTRGKEHRMSAQGKAPSAGSSSKISKRGTRRRPMCPASKSIAIRTSPGC
jgi:hypothetical protein